MTRWYILKGEEIVPSDIVEYSKWCEKNDMDRIIAKTNVDDACVSTVFLGLDHSHGLDGAPILFETMIFGGKHDQLQWRYASLEEAKLGHEALVNKLKRYETIGDDK